MVLAAFYALPSLPLWWGWFGGGLTQRCSGQEHLKSRPHVSQAPDIDCIFHIGSLVGVSTRMLHVSFSFFFSKVFVFGTLTEWLHFYNKGLYCSLWIVNGLLQSTGWPCVVAVMGNWFGKAGYAPSSFFHFSI